MGKFRGVAKGAKRSRRRFGANLDLLSLVRVHGFERPQRELLRIDGADLLEHVSNMREDLRSFAVCSYLAEWVEGCTALRQPLEGLLRLILDTLRRMTSDRGGGEELLRIFEIKTLQLAGYAPKLDACVACGGEIERKGGIPLDVGRGGILCRRCHRGNATGLRVSLGTLRVLEEARRIPMERTHRLGFSARSLEESRSVTRAFYIRHVGRPLRSSAFLDGVLRGGEDISARVSQIADRREE